MFDYDSEPDYDTFSFKPIELTISNDFIEQEEIIRIIEEPSNIS